MKSFNRLMIVVMLVMAFFIVGANLIFISSDKDDIGRPYRVEAERIAYDIEHGSYHENDLKDYLYITSVTKLAEENEDVFYNTNSDYIIRIINNDLYRFNYSYSSENSDDILILNICLVFAVVLVLVLLFIIKYRIIRPFEEIKEVPFELAKGHLSMPLKESKGEYFGRFVWGLDLLREKLESQKARELELQKEKKTLVLSLSHDIKTPLGVIELYSKALEKGLYTDEQKKKETAQNIALNCNEIKNYINDIIKASNNEFLEFEVNNEEFYLSELVDTVQEFYNDKLTLLKTDFTVGEYRNRVLKGDIDRSVEVLQNIVENAVKYGDGKQIRVSFSDEEDCTLISVSNSGCTLNENELSHIFESFWRGSNVGSVAGSGLGLYICRHLMRKMNGDIFAECENEEMCVTAVFMNA